MVNPLLRIVVESVHVDSECVSLLYIDVADLDILSEAAGC